MVWLIQLELEKTLKLNKAFAKLSVHFIDKTKNMDTKHIPQTLSQLHSQIANEPGFVSLVRTSIVKVYFHNAGQILVYVIEVKIKWRKKELNGDPEVFLKVRSFAA